MSFADDTGAVVMAVYRPDPELLERQVSSIRSQTLTRWQCFVGIDGEDPHTHALVRDLVSGDDRFLVHHFEENWGVYRNFERLLRLVPGTARWVSLADQDDNWYSDKLERLVALLDLPDAMAAVGAAYVVDRHGHRVDRTRRRPGDVMSTMLQNQLTGSLAVVRREVVEFALPFPVDSGCAIHDHWLAVCATRLGHIVSLDEVVQDYVQHHGNVIGEVPLKSALDVVREIRQVGHPVRYLDDFVDGPWRWRVDMAESLVQRGSSDYSRTALGHLRNGRLGFVGTSRVVSELVQGRITIVAALGLVAASVRFRWRRLAADRSSP